MNDTKGRDKITPQVPATLLAGDLSSGELDPIPWTV